MLPLEVFKEFSNLSGEPVQEEAPAKETCEKNETESALSNGTCTSDSASVENHVRQHQKLHKVSTGVTDQNSELLMWKGGRNSHRPVRRDTFSLSSVMEKLVESAHFGKLGMIKLKLCC